MKFRFAIARLGTEDKRQICKGAEGKNLLQLFLCSPAAFIKKEAKNENLEVNSSTLVFNANLGISKE
ncbi:MAG: hypothetical protein V7K89_20860 [Nostoc sp.]|uniref:hypothetical protein n=1 Tax=Nostoc sp. TaxID=1180 RepID=UPI002FF69A7C